MIHIIGVKYVSIKRGFVCFVILYPKDGPLTGFCRSFSAERSS